MVGHALTSLTIYAAHASSAHNASSNYANQLDVTSIMASLIVYGGKTSLFCNTQIVEMDPSD